MTTPFLAAALGQTTEILTTLFIMLAAAKITAEIFERLKQPAVVGEILAGVLIGGSVLGWVAPSDFTNTLAEIGVIFLLFTVGLETKPSSIFKVGKLAAIVAVLGVIVPFVCGYLLMLAWGAANVERFLSARLWWQPLSELRRGRFPLWDFSTRRPAELFWARR